jgi:hypothetical protein
VFSIEELQAEVRYQYDRVSENFNPDELAGLDDFEAAVVKLTAQKYEAIIEQRVAETVRQRLEHPEPGDFVVRCAERRREELTAKLGRMLEAECQAARGQWRKTLIRACDRLRAHLGELEWAEAEVKKANAEPQTWATATGEEVLADLDKMVKHLTYRDDK